MKQRLRNLINTIRGPFGEHHWLIYAGVFILALIARVGWVLWVNRPGFAFNDSMMYQMMASQLMKGNGYALLDSRGTLHTTAQWPPGYATLLAGIYSIFGDSTRVGELANAVIGAATSLAVLQLGRRVNDLTTGVVAGVIFALMPGTIMWTDVLVTETVYTGLFTCFFLLLSYAQPTWRWAIILGAAIGLGAFFRGEALAWGILPIVLFWPALRSGAIPGRRFAKNIAIAIASLAVVISPWVIRNAVVLDAFVPVANNASQTLWSGHHADATGGQTYPDASYFDQFNGTGLNRELEAGKVLRNEALEYMVTHPIHELQLIPLKLIHLMRGDSYILDWVNAPAAGNPPPISDINVERIGVLADAAFYGVLALTALAWAWLGRRWWSHPVLRCVKASFIFSLILYGFVYYGNYRYRFPQEPLMILASSVFLVELWRRRPGDTTTAEG